VAQPRLTRRPSASRNILIAAGESVLIHLGLDIGAANAGEAVQLIHLYLIIEVADVTNDGLILHGGKVVDGNNIHIAGGGDIDISPAKRILDGGYFKAFHGGLQCIDGIDLGDNDAGAPGRAAIARSPCRHRHNRNDGYLAGDHHIERAVDAIDEGVAAAVQLSNLDLVYGVIDVEGGDEKLAGFLQLVETMNTSGGLFADAAPFLHQFMPAVGICGVQVLEQVLDDFLLVAAEGVLTQSSPSSIGSLCE